MDQETNEGQKRCPVWSTGNELEFLRNLGTHRSGSHRTAGQGTVAGLKDLLRGYLAGCRRRVNWGSIDKKIVMAEAEAMLESLV